MINRTLAQFEDREHKEMVVLPFAVLVRAIEPIIAGDAGSAEAIAEYIEHFEDYMGADAPVPSAIDFPAARSKHHKRAKPMPAPAEDDIDIVEVVPLHDQPHEDTSGGAGAPPTCEEWIRDHPVHNKRVAEYYRECYSEGVARHRSEFVERACAAGYTIKKVNNIQMIFDASRDADEPAKDCKRIAAEWIRAHPPGDRRTREYFGEYKTFALAFPSGRALSIQGLSELVREAGFHCVIVRGHRAWTSVVPLGAT